MDKKQLLSMVLIVGACMLILPRILGTNTPSAKPAYGAVKNAVTGEWSKGTYKDLADSAAVALAPLETFQLGSAAKNSKDKIAVTISNQMAGIEKVQLNINDYAETVDRKEPLTLFEAPAGFPSPFSTLSFSIWLGTDPLVHVVDQKIVWMVDREKTDSTHVVLTLPIKINGKEVAQIVKTFSVDPASYDIRISHTVRNLTDQLVRVRIDQLGPSELPRDDPQSDDRIFQAARLDSGAKQVNTSKAPFRTISQIELPKTDTGTKGIGQMTDYANDPYLWIASGNRFFVTVMRPLPVESTVATLPASAPATELGAARLTLKLGKTIPLATHVTSLDLDLMKWAEKPADVVSIVRFSGTVVDVAPMASVTEPFAVYMGPKNRDLLAGNDTAAVDSPEYSHFFYQYRETIQLSQGGCYSFCTSEQVVTPILWLLGFFHNTIAFGNYGVAIMILVIVVRAAMHPLTRASQINMAVMAKKMKDVAPQIEAIKKKHAGNKQKIGEEQMRVYRENKVNPAGGVLGCLPMLIQMPIWAALWSGLRTDIDLRHAMFIPGWINDLSHPDTIIPSALPVIGHPLFTLPVLGEIYGLNLLPLLLGAVFFFQMKVTTASQPAPADPQQAQMQNISKYMIFIFPLFLYSAPSGLNLYIFASTMGGLLDTWLVRKTLKKKGILPANAPTLPTHEAKV